MDEEALATMFCDLLSIFASLRSQHTPPTRTPVMLLGTACLFVVMCSYAHELVPSSKISLSRRSMSIVYEYP